MHVASAHSFNLSRQIVAYMQPAEIPNDSWPRERTSATILTGVIDWLGMRTALKVLREASGLKPAAFARIIKVHKATVPRVEDIVGRPAYKPDLETIDRWLKATDNSSVSLFLARFEEARARDTERAGVVGGDTSLRGQAEAVAERRALRADLLHDIGNAIIASASDPSVEGERELLEWFRRKTTTDGQRHAILRMARELIATAGAPPSGVRPAPSATPPVSQETTGEGRGQKQRSRRR